MRCEARLFPGSTFEWGVWSFTNSCFVRTHFRGPVYATRDRGAAELTAKRMDDGANTLTELCRERYEVRPLQGLFGVWDNSLDVWVTTVSGNLYDAPENGADFTAAMLNRNDRLAKVA